MIYTRIYPMAARSYAQQTVKGRCTVTASSSDISVSDAAYAAALAGYVVTIYQGDTSDIFASYQVDALVAPNSLTLKTITGAAWTAPAGSSGQYDFLLFDPDAPSANDFTPAALVFSTVPGSVGSGDEMEVILASGQYAVLPGDIFVAGAIYAISIKEILNTGTARGYLLGNDGLNGRSFI